MTANPNKPEILIRPNASGYRVGSRMEVIIMMRKLITMMEKLMITMIRKLIVMMKKLITMMRKLITEENYRWFVRLKDSVGVVGRSSGAGSEATFLTA